MTSSEVKYVINTSLGEELNKITPLVSISYIMITKLELLYANKELMRFYFDTKNELLKVYHCKKYNGPIYNDWEVGKHYDILDGTTYKYLFDSETLEPYVDVYDFSQIKMIAPNFSLEGNI